MRGADSATLQIVGWGGGDLGLVIEPRLYRAAFVPALIATILAMFSLEARPPALPQGLAADVLFDGNIAAASARAIASAAPDRRPGTPGDAATAGRGAGTPAARGFLGGGGRFRGQGKQPVKGGGRRTAKA